MATRQEILWDFPAVTPGQAGTTAVVPITAENISEYARVAQHPDPKYHAGTSDQASGEGLVAMPTMVLSYAPWLREDIAEANGFVALEQSQTVRRQTPFTKCEIRWSQPVFAGDTIASTRKVLEKYERRGSKFVTFRVTAANQRREPVAEYDYTCIFEYASGRREVPQDRGSADSAPSQDNPQRDPASPSPPLALDSIAAGTPLAALAITESQEIINGKNDFRLAGSPSLSNIHTDEEFARQNIFGGLVNSGPATMSYVDQMLGLSFPQPAFYSGGRLLMRAIEPFRVGDTVTFQGEVTAIRVEDGKRLIECRVKGTNQRGDLVCLADAVLVLPG